MLRRLYVDNHLSVSAISRTMRRGDTNIRERVKHLSLRRSEVEFKRRWDERRDQARARMVAMMQDRVRSDLPPQNKDEEHSARCIAQGGFPVLAINYPPGRAA
jgi:hypothetical protein